jgi:hypothetical protein
VVSDGGMRASDCDREKVAEILREAYAEGRLSLDEFDDRTTAAYAAKTWGDLRGLTNDLPAGADLGPPEPVGSAAAVWSQHPSAQPTGRRVVIPFLPLAFLFLVLATSAHAAVLFVPAVIMLLVWRAARRGRGPGHGPRGGGVPPRTGGVPPRTGNGPA